jgi:endopeptidase Clp ATP-binding regulatory subunit ClpX
MSDKKLPTPEEIQKEFEEFIRDRFGGSVQVITHPIGGSHSHRVRDEDDRSTKNSPKSKEKSRLNFDLTPKEIKAHLDRFVIKQDEAKRALAIAVCDHYNRVKEMMEQGETDDYEYQKQNVLLLGPTGVGKSYLIKHIAKLVGVPFVKADATRFTEMGYVGANADDLIKDLVSQAKGDIELAQYGIVYLDEADKLASSPNAMDRDVSGRGVQFSFLKLMEETDVDLRAANDPASQMQAFMEMQQKGKIERRTVNTKNILFIVSGAFTGLEEIISKRLNTARIGFQTDSHTTPDTTDLFDFATTQDFVEFGYEPEFIGRLPVRVACHPLSVEDLFAILKNSKGSIIRQYVQSFRNYGIEAEFSDDALLAIARAAHEQKTGARALMTVMEGIFRNFKFELPNRGIERLVVSQQLIEHPDRELARLVSQYPEAIPLAIRRIAQTFEQEFFERHQMKIRLTRDALQFLTERANDPDMTPIEFLNSALQSYEHGLKLIQQNSGIQEFEITRQVLESPKAVLERWIRQSYLDGNQPSGTPDSPLH